MGFFDKIFESGNVFDPLVQHIVEQNNLNVQSDEEILQRLSDEYGWDPSWRLGTGSKGSQTVYVPRDESGALIDDWGSYAVPEFSAPVQEPISPQNDPMDTGSISSHFTDSGEYDPTFGLLKGYLGLDDPFGDYYRSTNMGRMFNAEDAKSGSRLKEGEYMYGDVNRDGSYGLSDVLSALKYRLGITQEGVDYEGWKQDVGRSFYDQGSNLSWNLKEEGYNDRADFQTIGSEFFGYNPIPDPTPHYEMPEWGQNFLDWDTQRLTDLGFERNALEWDPYGGHFQTKEGGSVSGEYTPEDVLSTWPGVFGYDPITGVDSVTHSEAQDLFSDPEMAQYYAHLVDSTGKLDPFSAEGRYRELKSHPFSQDPISAAFDDLGLGYVGTKHTDPTGTGPTDLAQRGWYGLTEDGGIDYGNYIGPRDVLFDYIATVEPQPIPETPPPMRGVGLGERRDSSLPTGVGQYIDGEWTPYVDDTPFGLDIIESTTQGIKQDMADKWGGQQVSVSDAGELSLYDDPTPHSDDYRSDWLSPETSASDLLQEGQQIVGLDYVPEGYKLVGQDQMVVGKNYVPEGYFGEEYWQPQIDTAVSEAQAAWQEGQNQSLIDMYGGSIEPETGNWVPDPSTLISSDISEAIATVDAVTPATDMSDLPEQITEVSGEATPLIQDPPANYSLSLNAVRQTPVQNVYGSTATSRYPTPSKAAVGTLAEYQTPHGVLGTTQYARPVYIGTGISSLLSGKPFSPTSPMTGRIKRAF